MNTTMADGAEQRLDAQIAEALFGQPGMSKMDVANRVRELRGDGPALLVPREAGQDERARFEAWYVGNAFDYEKNPIGSRECSLMWKAWQAGLATRQTAGREPVGYLYDWTHSSALGRGEETFTAFTPDIEAARGSKGAVNIRPVYAAQPSPGGQGESMSISDDDRAVLQRLQDALPTAGISGWAKGVEVLERLLRDSLAARQPVGVPADTLRALADRWASDRDYTGSPVDDIRALIDAPTFARQPEGATVKDSLTIAARQPVGQEPVAWLVHWSDMPLESPEVTRSASRIAEVSALTNPPRIVPLYTAPPAQQADQEYLESLDRALEGVIDQRDRYHEVADDLASHIARIIGVDIGEHSSANCPWQNAIEAAEEYQPVQAVDLGQLRRYEAIGSDGMNMERVPDGRWVKLDDVLALIDCKAVGK